MQDRYGINRVKRGHIRIKLCLFGIYIKTILKGFSNSEFGLPATVGQLGLSVKE